MRYLLRCAKEFITEAHPNGTSLWSSVQKSIEFVLTHPNGWEGSQQNQIRDAAVLAELVPDTDEGQSRINFVTEGEGTHLLISISIHLYLTSAMLASIFALLHSTWSC